MGLAAINVAITPTPSHILDGHYPDGNDGTGAIPLTWAVVPDFMQKQQGTPFSVNLFSTYLTQPGDLSATASLKSGSLSGGWTLASNGLLSYDGSGVASGTIQVRATRFGFTSDTNSFSFQSIAVIVNPDNQAPTIPTGLSLVSKTVNSILVQCDAPFDAPTATIPASGLKEVRFFKNGSFDGVSAITGGKSVLLSAADVGQGSVRRYYPGHYVAISDNQRQTAGGLPNPNATSDVGPVAADTVAIVMRYTWKELEPTDGNFNFTRITKEIGQCQTRGVRLFVMIVVRTFTGSGASQNPMPPGLQNKASPFSGNLPGWQGWRWDPTVQNRFNNLVTAIGLAFNANTFFAGIATQETSTGTLPGGTGYTAAGYEQALKNESNYISGACPNARHFWYFNFLNGAGSNDLARQALGRVAVVVQANGGIVGGPDLVTDLAPGGIPNRCYPIYTDVHTGVGSAANGTTGLAGTGPTFCSVQTGEWSGNNAGDPNPNMPDLYNYATASFTYTTGGARDHRSTAGALASPLNLDIIVWDWHNSGNPQFNNDATAIFHAHPTFGTYSAPGSMVAGSLSQSGVDYNVTGAGTGIGASSDQWSVGRVQCNGDFTLIAKLAGITGADTSGAIAGISIRETTDPAARAAHLLVTTSKLRSRYRGAPSAAMTNVVDVAGQNWSATKWLKIVRAGSTFTYFYSTDGLVWTAMGSATIGMGTSVYAELFASSVTVATTVTAAFKQVNVQSLASPTYTYTGLAPGTLYNLTALTRDQAPNDSAQCATLAVTTG